MSKSKNEIKAWVKAIIPHFSNSDNWAVNENWQGFGVALDGKDGARLVIHTAFNNDDRLIILGYFPGHEDHLPCERPKTDITVGRKRPPKAIAKDIERRLLPAYYQVLEQARQNKAEHIRMKQEQDVAMKALADALPRDAFTQNGTLVAYNFHFLKARWKPYGNAFELKFEASLEEALKIIEILKEK